MSRLVWVVKNHEYQSMWLSVCLCLLIWITRLLKKATDLLTLLSTKMRKWISEPSDGTLLRGYRAGLLTLRGVDPPSSGGGEGGYGITDYTRPHTVSVMRSSAPNIRYSRRIFQQWNQSQSRDFVLVFEIIHIIIIIWCSDLTHTLLCTVHCRSNMLTL